jgi:uncharacterized membrane protein HdeD (DUF308 family)
MPASMVRMILGILVGLVSLAQLAKIPARTFESDAEKFGYTTGTVVFAIFAVLLIVSGIMKLRKRDQG